jgi:hypothetical protein
MKLGPITIDLIPEWKTSWRFSSVRVAALLSLLSALQSDVLPLARDVFSPEMFSRITLGLAIAIVLLRNVSLGKTTDDKEPPQ